MDRTKIATDLMSSTQKALAKRSQIEFDEEPKVQGREIVEFNSRMRVSGLEKFNDPSYIAVIEIYASQADLDKKDVLGAVVLYVKESVADKLFRILGYRDFNETDEESMMDTCGEMCNTIVKEFEGQLSSSGYNGLVFSPPRKYINTVDEGVAFKYEEQNVYDISFHAFNEKIFCLDVTLAPLGK